MNFANTYMYDSIGNIIEYFELNPASTEIAKTLPDN